MGHSGTGQWARFACALCGAEQVAPEWPSCCGTCGGGEHGIVGWEPPGRWLTLHGSAEPYRRVLDRPRGAEAGPSAPEPA